MTCKYYSDNGICTNEACVVTKCPLSQDHFICRYYSSDEQTFTNNTVSTLHNDINEIVVRIDGYNNDRNVAIFASFPPRNSFPLKIDKIIVYSNGKIALMAKGCHIIEGMIK